MSQASVDSLLEALTMERIREVARDAGLAPRGKKKDQLVADVGEAHSVFARY